MAGIHRSQRYYQGCWILLCRCFGSDLTKLDLDEEGAWREGAAPPVHINDTWVRIAEGVSIREPYEEADHAGIRFPFKPLARCRPLARPAGYGWGGRQIRAVVSAILEGRYTQRWSTHRPHRQPSSGRGRCQALATGVGVPRRMCATARRHGVTPSWADLSRLPLVLLTSYIASHPQDGAEAVERFAANRGPAITL
jgi:hypothetical protein